MGLPDLLMGDCSAVVRMVRVNVTPATPVQEQVRVIRYVPQSSGRTSTARVAVIRMATPNVAYQAAVPCMPCTGPVVPPPPSMPFSGPFPVVNEMNYDFRFPPPMPVMPNPVFGPRPVSMPFTCPIPPMVFNPPPPPVPVTPCPPAPMVGGEYVQRTYDSPQPTAEQLPPPAPCGYVPAAPAVSCLHIVAAKDHMKLDIEAADIAGATCKEMSLKTADGSSLKVTAHSGHLEVTGSFFHATADRLSRPGQDRIILEGNVHLSYDKNGAHGELQAGQIAIGLSNGSMELKPPSEERTALKTFWIQEMWSHIP
jgi:hypothetical protein